MSRFSLIFSKFSRNLKMFRNKVEIFRFLSNFSTKLLWKIFKVNLNDFSKHSFSKNFVIISKISYTFSKKILSAADLDWKVFSVLLDNEQGRRSYGGRPAGVVAATSIFERFSNACHTMTWNIHESYHTSNIPNFPTALRSHRLSFLCVCCVVMTTTFFRKHKRSLVLLWVLWGFLGSLLSNHCARRL